MDAKTTLNKIMTYLGMEEENKVIAVSFETKKIKDGETEFEAEEFAQGNAVFLINEDEEKIPAPEGMYAMEDDYDMTVDEQGMISAYEEHQPEEEEKEEEDVAVGEDEDKEKMSTENAPSNPKKVVETTSNTREMHFAEVEKIKLEFATERDALNSEKETYKSELTALSAELDELKKRLSEEPSAEPLKHSVEGADESVHFYKHKSKTRNTISDRVYSRMSNFNNK